jgi:hypothetical protein
MEIEKLVADLSKDPFNSRLNFAVAVEYERINQTASAVSFYLRTAEYSTTPKDPMVYAALLKMAHCFDHQTDRVATVTNCLLQAVAYDSNRPEGYFLLSQFCERQAKWQESYTWAQIGLDKPEYAPLPIHVGYEGRYCLEFQKAIAAYWVGRGKESEYLLRVLLTQDIHPQYANAIKYNLERITGVAV